MTRLPNAHPKPRKKAKRAPKSLKRSPVKRGTRVKRFAKRRDPQYVAWIRTLPCILRGEWYYRGNTPIVHYCVGAMQVCHVKSRGAGGDDRGNTVAMCAAAHLSQHELGIKVFEERWHVDLKANANLLEREYGRITADGEQPR